MKWKQVKIKTMETYSSFQKPITFMYFWMNYCYENHHIERILIAMKNIDHLFNLASEMIGADNLHLFLLFDGTRIDNNEYLSSLENGTELIVCTEEQIQKLLIYFELKRYLSFKNISYPLDTNYFLWYSKYLPLNRYRFIEAVISGTRLVLFKVFFNSFYIWLWASEKSSKQVRSL